MRRHDPGQAGLERRPIGRDVLLQDFGKASSVFGDAHVRVGDGKAVTGEMLAHRRHAGVGEALHDGRREGADSVRVEMQRAVADHRARPVVEVQHRREAEIDAVRPELRTDDVGRAARRLLRERLVAVPQAPQVAHRRDGGEAIPEALHPPALVVDADQKRWFA